MGQKHTKYSVLIAIDFGTTYSGYAYSFRRDKGEIHPNPNWGAEMGSTQWKTPTSLMYDSDGKFDNFGSKAEDIYFRQIEEAGEASTDNGPTIYRCFKMQLYGEEQSSQFKQMAHKMELTSDDGKIKLALDVFADSLKYMKEHALNHIKQSEGMAPEDDSVLWVVTVPAIWKDRQKIFMREACLKARLIKQLNSRNLLIALEPECASMFCRNLSWDKFVGLERDRKPKLNPGTIYMTVDLGGGTLDITVHKVAGDGKVEEVIPPLGGPHGGNRVNEAFTEKLSEVLGKEFITYVKTKRPTVWLRVVNQFETIKRSFEDGKDLRMQMYLGFANCYEEKYGETLMQKFNSLPDDLGIKLSANSDLVISSKTMEQLFEDVVGDITNKLFEALNKTKEKKDSYEVKYVFLVGGFSDCKYIQKSVKHIEDTYDPKPVVLVPKEASLSVLKGAVVFGHNPEAIKSRVSQLTYAILSERPYKEKRDHRERMVRVGKKLVVRYLDTIIKKGEGVSEGTMRTRTVQIPKSMRSVEKNVYISQNRTIDDPESADVKRFGKIVVELTTAESRKKQKDVEIQFIFGNTELEVRVADDSVAKVSVQEYEETSNEDEMDKSGIAFEGKKQEPCVIM